MERWRHALRTPRSERPRRDLLRQEPVRPPGGETKKIGGDVPGASALPRTLPRPYYLATIDTSVARTWRQQDRKQRRFHSPRAARSTQESDRSRICTEGEPSGWGTGERLLGSRFFRLQRQEPNGNGLTTCPERSLDERAKAA